MCFRAGVVWSKSLNQNAVTAIRPISVHKLWISISGFESLGGSQSKINDLPEKQARTEALLSSSEKACKM